MVFYLFLKQNGKKSIDFALKNNGKPCFFTKIIVSHLFLKQNRWINDNFALKTNRKPWFFRIHPFFFFFFAKLSRRNLNIGDHTESSIANTTFSMVG